MNQRGCSTPSRVSTVMGDRLRAIKPSRSVTRSTLSLLCPPWDAKTSISVRTEQYYDDGECGPAANADWLGLNGGGRPPGAVLRSSRELYRMAVPRRQHRKDSPLVSRLTSWTFDPAFRQ